MIFFLLSCKVPEPQSSSFRLGDPRECAAPGDGIRLLPVSGVGLDTSFVSTLDAWNQDVAGVTPMVVEDLDGDGDLDYVQGQLSGFFHSQQRPEFRIYANNGHGAFSLASISPPMASNDSRVQTPRLLSITAVDLMGDSLPELVAAGVGAVEVFPNLGNLQFGEPIFLVEEPATISNAYQSMEFGDLDGDGSLDLALPVMTGAGPPAGELGNPAPARIYYRRDDHFVEGPSLASLPDGNTTLVSVLSDYDQDGDLDFLTMSDRVHPANLWRNDGNSHFEDVAASLGVDILIAGMGIASADLNGDGWSDYCFTDVAPIHCLLSQGGPTYADAGQALGLVPNHPNGTWGTAGWSLEMEDFDNDGLLDAFQASGACSAILPLDPEDLFPDLLFAGQPDGSFLDVGDEKGFSTPGQHYGAVAADLDGDGFLDLLVGGPAQPPQMWRGGCTSGNWLEVDLAGPQGNREGYGAVVEVEAGGKTWSREMLGLRSPASGPSRLHFGLGTADRIEHLRVRWPDGTLSETGPLEGRRVVWASE